RAQEALSEAPPRPGGGPPAVRGRRGDLPQPGLLDRAARLRPEHADRPAQLLAPALDGLREPAAPPLVHCGRLLQICVSGGARAGAAPAGALLRDRAQARASPAGLAGDVRAARRAGERGAGRLRPPVRRDADAALGGAARVERGRPRTFPQARPRAAALDAGVLSGEPEEDA